MINKVILVGNLGNAAELKYTQGGQAVSSFSVCTSEKWIDKQGKKQERSEWHRCVFWGKPAEAVNKYLEKGKQVYVEGRLQTRNWEDKDGGKRYSTEIVVSELKLLGGNKHGRTDDGHLYDKETGEVRGQNMPGNDDDVPF